MLLASLISDNDLIKDLSKSELLIMSSILFPDIIYHLNIYIVGKNNPQK